MHCIKSTNSTAFHASFILKGGVEMLWNFARQSERSLTMKKKNMTVSKLTLSKGRKKHISIKLLALD